MINSDIKSLLIAGLIVVSVILSIRIGFYKSEIANLNAEIANNAKRADICEAKLEEQNTALKSVKSENLKQNEPEIGRIKKIYIKDKSCESELKAYKELFK